LRKTRSKGPLDFFDQSSLHVEWAARQTQSVGEAALRVDADIRDEELPLESVGDDRRTMPREGEGGQDSAQRIVRLSNEADVCFLTVRVSGAGEKRFDTGKLVEYPHQGADLTIYCFPGNRHLADSAVGVLRFRRVTGAEVTWPPPLLRPR
jgi:hypothetical protein